MNKYFKKSELVKLHHLCDAVSKSKKMKDSISSEYVKELKRVMPKLYLHITNKTYTGVPATEITASNCNAYTDEKNVEKFMIKLANKLHITDFDTYVSRDRVSMYIFLE